MWRLLVRGYSVMMEASLGVLLLWRDALISHGYKHPQLHPDNFRARPHLCWFGSKLLSASVANRLRMVFDATTLTLRSWLMKSFVYLFNPCICLLSSSSWWSYDLSHYRIFSLHHPKILFVVGNFQEFLGKGLGLCLCVVYLKASNKIVLFIY